MKINLNEPFTFEDVAKLIASKDDSEHRQLRVTSEGIAYLSDDVGIDNLEGLAFRLETWAAGTDHAGKMAARDEKFVRSIEKVLRDNWPNPSDEYIDIY